MKIARHAIALCLTSWLAACGEPTPAAVFTIPSSSFALPAGCSRADVLEESFSLKIHISGHNSDKCTSERQPDNTFVATCSGITPGNRDIDIGRSIYIAYLVSPDNQTAVTLALLAQDLDIWSGEVYDNPHEIVLSPDNIITTASQLDAATEEPFSKIGEFLTEPNDIDLDVDSDDCENLRELCTGDNNEYNNQGIQAGCQ